MFSRVPMVALAIPCLVALAACGDAARAPIAGCDDGGCDTTCPDAGCGPNTPDLDGLGRYSSAALLPDGRLAVATQDSARRALVLAIGAPDEPPTLTVLAGADAGPPGAEAGAYTRLAVGPDGALHVAWYDPDEGALYWMHGHLSGFEPPERVDGGDGARRGAHLSLALDARGAPHLAYRDEVAHALRYAYREPRPDGAVWHTQPIDGCAGEPGCPTADEDFGEWTGLALLANAGGPDRPRIAFYDRLRGDLKMAARVDETDAGEPRWVTSTLDGRDLATGLDTGDVGRHLSLAVTPTRGLGLAYFDATRGALRYLGPGEPPRIVDAGVIDAEGRRRRLTVGQFPSLAYDTQGGAHIVHVDATTPGLRHVLVLGAAPPAPRALPLPAGGWVSLAAAGERLVGAYGAFSRAPDTRLERFDLPLGAPR